MSIKKWISILGVWSHHSFAIDTQQFVATLSVAPAWYTAGETQTLVLQPGLSNTYVAQTPIKTFATGALFLGMQGFLQNHMFWQGGTFLALNENAKLQGNVWELGEPTFDNFLYRYQVQHWHIAWGGKLLSDAFSRLYYPYLSASLGVAFNRSYGFYSVPYISEAVAQPPFQSHTQTAFTYTVGLGLLHVLDQHWQVGVGYDFADEGKSRLGPLSGQTTATGLTLNHLYINALQFSLTYLS